MENKKIVRFLEGASTNKAMAEKIVALAGENGFDFTVEELREFISTLGNLLVTDSVKALSDTESEKVWGGRADWGAPTF